MYGEAMPTKDDFYLRLYLRYIIFSGVCYHTAWYQAGQDWNPTPGLTCASTFFVFISYDIIYVLVTFGDFS